MAAEAGGMTYARQATGLVREISIVSAIALNVSFMSIAYAVLTATQAPFAFPGADPFWSVTICAVLCIVPTMLFGLFSGIMPRAGGDYVFVSRTLHPWLGFAFNFNLVTWYILSGATSAFLIAPFGLSSAFTTIGATTHSETLIRWGAEVTSKNWSFGVGVAALLLTWIVVSINIRYTLRVVVGVFLVSLLCVGLAIVILAINTRGDFVAAVHRYGGSYAGIIHQAHTAGYPGSSNFSLKNTLLSMPIAFDAFGYAIVTAYAGSELRGRRTSGLRGMLYSLALAGVLTAVLMALSDRVFGNNFMGSATYLSNTGSSHYPFVSPSFFFFFVSMLTHSTIVIALIGIGFIAAAVAGFPAIFIAASRSIFAWSFDRLLPTRLSAVSDRTHSPNIANAVVAVVSLAYLAFLAYGPVSLLQILYTVPMAQLVTFIVVAIAGAWFPYRRPRMYQDSPVRRAIGGIPVLAAIGVLSVAIYGFFFYALATSSALGANTSTGWKAVGIILVLGFGIYLVSMLVNRRRSIDVSLSFRELPPE